MKSILVICIVLFIGVSAKSQRSDNSTSSVKLPAELPIPPKPTDHQAVQDQNDMTWDDYRPIPGRNRATVTLRVQSESDPSKTTVSSYTIRSGR